MKTVLRILVYLVSSPLIVFGVVLTAMTLIMGVLGGGPREPPSGMAWEEFAAWRDSGRWFWEALFQGLALVVLPLLAIWGVNRWTRK